MPVCVTGVTEWALAFTTMGTPFEKKRWDPSGKAVRSIPKYGKAHKSIVRVAVGQEWICLKANMEKLKLSHSSTPIQQMTLIAPEQGRVQERVSGGRAAPSLLAATSICTG